MRHAPQLARVLLGPLQLQNCCCWCCILAAAAELCSSAAKLAGPQLHVQPLSLLALTLALLLRVQTLVLWMSHLPCRDCCQVLQNLGHCCCFQWGLSSWQALCQQQPLQCCFAGSQQAVEAAAVAAVARTAVLHSACHPQLHVGPAA